MENKQNGRISLLFEIEIIIPHCIIYLSAIFPFELGGHVWHCGVGGGGYGIFDRGLSGLFASFSCPL